MVCLLILPTVPSPAAGVETAQLPELNVDVRQGSAMIKETNLPNDEERIDLVADKITTRCWIGQQSNEMLDREKQYKRHQLGKTRMMPRSELGSWEHH